MYLETYTKNTMLNSICIYLNTSETELYTAISKAKQSAVNGSSTDLCAFMQKIKEFIAKQRKSERIDRVLFFHLGRRLNGSEDNDALNLKELLTTKTTISDFLKSHCVELIPNDNYIDIVYKGKLQSLDSNSLSGTPEYLKLRLGYYKDRSDSCFNGFAFKDRIYKSTYARGLSEAPEFILRIAEFVDNNNIMTDYKNNSKYYCFEYLTPLKEVAFDKKDNLSEEEKVEYLLCQIIYRINEYSDKYIRDDCNPVLRLYDTSNMHSKYLVSKEEITHEMIS